MAWKAWSERAATLRAAAREAPDAVTQQSLLVLADDCEALAKETEPRGAEAAGRYAH